MNRSITQWVQMLLAVLLTVSFAVAQNITVTVTMSPRPAPHMNSWKTRQETVIMTIGNANGAMVQAKIRARLLRDGDLVAQTKDASMPVVSFPVGMSLYHAD
ncbi:MAG: hypothetical protein IPP94_17060, partial [Ignavibacteria bacterium]|nr:hypothetical protein [Ignavibacteria bacterium]